MIGHRYKLVDQSSLTVMYPPCLIVLVGVLPGELLPLISLPVQARWRGCGTVYGLTRTGATCLYMVVTVKPPTIGIQGNRTCSRGRGWWMAMGWRGLKAGTRRYLLKHTGTDTVSKIDRTNEIALFVICVGCAISHATDQTIWALGSGETRQHLRCWSKSNATKLLFQNWMLN